jgi:hypothetical protein
MVSLQPAAAAAGKASGYKQASSAMYLAGNAVHAPHLAGVSWLLQALSQQVCKEGRRIEQAHLLVV